jgi:predicted TIM-barrel fold metal-dependent hydrolase
MYSSDSIDLDNVVAIDTHVHIELDDHGNHALPQNFRDAAAKYFKNNDIEPNVDSLAEMYRERKMLAVVFTVDASTNLGHAGISNEAVLEGAIRNSDVLIPFASVDPLKGKVALDQAKELVQKHGMRGFKFHPTMQNFDPSSKDYLPLFKTIEELEVPVVMHTGQTGIGAGLPGGGGLRLALSNPMLLDAVAAECKTLQIVMAHPSVPWQDEAISVATHKENVWIDLSGWSPKYFPENLVRMANSILQDKVLFGSDFPLITPDRWMNDFEKLEIKPEVRTKILKTNAVRLLGLSN